MALKMPIEQVVIREVEKYLAKSDQCPCAQCRDDAVALALKKLPNRYASTNQGEVLLNVELQSIQLQLDVERAVDEACRVVHVYPRHDDEHKYVT